MEQDFSEYDKYRFACSNRKNVKLDFFSNKASFFPERKQFYVTVDNYWEPEFMQQVIDCAEQASGISESELPPEDLVEQEKLSREDLETNRNWYRIFTEKYNLISRDTYISDPAGFPTAETVNVLNGATISLNYGEGILDFIYADFVNPLRKAIQFSMLLESVRDNSGETEPKPPLASEPEKIYDRDQLTADDYFAYKATFRDLMDVANASLYSAICPPQFKGGFDGQTKKIRWYGDYLLALQKEYLELIKFCYDEDYHPELLKGRYPSERLALYRTAHGLPHSFSREEQLELCHRSMGGREMPFGMKQEELLAHIKQFRLETTDEERRFAAELGISDHKLLMQLIRPTFMSISYSFGSIAQILELELTKMMEQNVRFRKCKRCGKYFIMKGNYDTNYCDRIAEGETRTCQELAAIENYKAKIADDKAIPIYNKYYKRYAARLKVRQIKEADFKKWKYQAMAKRDECSAGTITPEEYTEWMEAAFPNRTPKNK